MDDVRELVSYLSKAERGYTKTLNREFLKAGFFFRIVNKESTTCTIDFSLHRHTVIQLQKSIDHSLRIPCQFDTGSIR